MPHGQASKEARVFKNLAAPSGTAGESFISSWTNGVDGDDLSLFPSTGSTSSGILLVYLGGSKIFRMDHTALHLDEATAGASTLWGSGGVRLGTSTNPFDMAWLGSHQIVRDSVAPTTWSGTGVFGYASIGAQSVTGAAQTLTPATQIMRLSAGAAASVLVVSAPPGDFPCILTIIFDDANVTMTDSGTGGAAGTMNLNGGNYVSTADGVLRLLWNNNPAAGNDRWLEISRTNP